MFARFYILIISLAFCLSGNTASAQSPYYYTVRKKDSLITEERSSLLYNNIYLQNNTARKMSLSVSFYLPEQWKTISATEYSIQLNAFEEGVVPLTLCKLPGATSQWEKVHIRIIRNNFNDTFHTGFHILNRPVQKFDLVPLSENDIQLSKEDRVKNISVKVRNKGNIAGDCTVEWKSAPLNINKKETIFLQPGKDTTVTLVLNIEKNRFNDFNMKGISCTIFEDNKTARSIAFRVLNVSSYKKDKLSAYKTMQLNVAAGYLDFGYSSPTYYFASNGALDIGENTSIIYNYQSKQYGLTNQYQKDIFSINLHHKKWDLNIGQMVNAQYFMTYGNGAELMYTDSNFHFKVWGNKHYKNTFLYNDNGGATFLYHLKKLKIENTVAVDHDTRLKNTSGLIDNKLYIIEKDRLSLSVSGGVGLNNHSNATARKLSDKLSTSFGYATHYSTNFKLSFRSNMLKNSLNYPGIQSGLFRHYHEVRQQVSRKMSLSVFYQYNSITNNYLRDTVYNSDVFTYNMERYGLTLARSEKSMRVSLSTGIMKQTRTSSFVPKYNYVQLNYRYNRKDLQLNFSSLSAIDPDGRKNDYITNTNLSARYRFMGLNSIYTRTVNNSRERNVELKYNETINISPYATFSLYKTTSVMLSYSVAKFLNNRFVAQYIGGSIRYAGLTNGLTFSVNTSLPLKAYKNDNYSGYYGVNYFTMTLSKNLNVPVFPRRKYHNLSLNLFYDENNNGERDANEKPVAGLPLKINGIFFNTDENGLARYRNVEKDTYNVDLYKSTDIEGYLPKNGSRHSIDLQTNSTLFIPYRKSKVIKGKIEVVLDSNSHKDFTPEKIKVVLTDLTGTVVQTTLTNENGEYYFNVASNAYRVSLNPRSFNADFKPDQLSFTADVLNRDLQEVNFTIRQKKRTVNIRKVTIN